MFFKIDRRNTNFGGSEHPNRFRWIWLGFVCPGQTHVAMSHQKALFSGWFVYEQVLAELDDVVWHHLGNQAIANRHQEGVMKILPNTLSLEIRVHAGKWRRHTHLT